MRIVNKTKWRTDDLKALFRAAAEEHGYREELKDTLVRVVTRNRTVGGTAYLGKVFSRSDDHSGYLINMHLPSPDRAERWIATRPDTTLPKILAQVFVHECDHAFSELRHKEMVASEDIDVPRAEGLPLRPAEPKRKPKATPATRAWLRLGHAAAKLKEHESRRRREEKLVAKWRRKVKYYEGRLEEMGEMGEGRMAATKKEEG